jgi:hypothetical protein
MKIPQVKSNSQPSVFQVVNNSKNEFNKKIKILNAEFTLSELKTVYKNALKQLSHDKFGRT